MGKLISGWTVPLTSSRAFFKDLILYFCILPVGQNYWKCIDFRVNTDDDLSSQPLCRHQAPTLSHQRIVSPPPPFFFFYLCNTDSSRPTVIQSNYAAIHPKANQTFNSLMVPHSVIGLCSETNKQCTSRLVIPWQPHMLSLLN